MEATLNQDWNQFKLLGGWLCLDFVNTLDARQSSEDAQEWLHSYADLVAWSQYTQILTKQQAEQLLSKAIANPEAAMVFERAIAYRETIYRIFSAIAANRAVDPTDLATFNSALVEAMNWLRIEPIAEGFTWTWAESGDRLDSMLWRVEHSAAELLTAKERGRVRECAAQDCSWLFVDTSRNRSRRWCDMEECGNRTKAQRYYQRHKK